MNGREEGLKDRMLPGPRIRAVQGPGQATSDHSLQGEHLRSTSVGDEGSLSDRPTFFLFFFFFFVALNSMYIER